MSLITASLAMMDASSCGDISRESPVDSLPICDHNEESKRDQESKYIYIYISM